MKCHQCHTAANRLRSRSQSSSMKVQKRRFSSSAPSHQTNTAHHHQHQRRDLIDSLNAFLLKPRSLPLPRYLSPRHYSFTYSEIFGHSSFILVAASYATDDFLHLRVMAVMGASSMVFFSYFHPHGRVLWLPLKWNALFIAINSYRILTVMWDRYKAEHFIQEELQKFREEHLYVVDPVDWYKLMSIGTIEEFTEGDLIMQQGRANPYIRVVLEGELEVRRDGVLTYVVEEGNFISEAGLHAGLMLGGTIESCASIVVGKRFQREDKDETKKSDEMSSSSSASATTTTSHSPSKKQRVRCIRWNRDELLELLQSDKALRNAMKAALSWDIVRKLKMQRHMLVEGRVHDAQAWTQKREDQGISRYAAILQNMLRHPENVEDMSGELTKYRIIHHIEDEDHAKALARAGWTESEFKAGYKKRVEDDDDFDDDNEFEKKRWMSVKRYTSKIIRFVKT
eukprot:scaffold308354_cov76-Cyclotella_meneghiniana.AAC.2